MDTKGIPMTATEELDAAMAGADLSSLGFKKDGTSNTTKEKSEAFIKKAEADTRTNNWYSKQGKKYGIAAGLGASIGGAYGLMKDRDRGRSSLGETSEYGAYGAATGALATGIWSGVQAFRGLK